MGQAAGRTVLALRDSLSHISCGNYHGRNRGSRDTYVPRVRIQLLTLASTHGWSACCAARFASWRLSRAQMRKKWRLPRSLCFREVCATQSCIVVRNCAQREFLTGHSASHGPLRIRNLQSPYSPISTESLATNYVVGTWRHHWWALSSLEPRSRV
jgi:hypothetical protein